MTGAALVAVAGTVALACVFGWKSGAGFATGALVSLGNFHLIARAVGGGLQGGLGGALWKGSLFRLGISGAVLLGALLFLRGALPAVVAGLLATHITMIAVWLFRFQAAAPDAPTTRAPAPRDPEAP